MWHLCSSRGHEPKNFSILFESRKGSACVGDAIVLHLLIGYIRSYQILAQTQCNNWGPGSHTLCPWSKLFAFRPFPATLFSCCKKHSKSDDWHNRKGCLNIVRVLGIRQAVRWGHVNDLRSFLLKELYKPDLQTSSVKAAFFCSLCDCFVSLCAYCLAWVHHYLEN